MREFFYAAIVRLFGVCDEEHWTSSSWPKNREGEFRVFLEEMAKHLNVLYPPSSRFGPFGADYLRVQLKWATTKQALVAERLSGNFILNKAAAYDVGFISAQYFPIDIAGLKFPE